MVAEFYASQMIATGQLVKVLESSRAMGYDISVVPQLKNVPPKLRVWIDFLVEIFTEVSWQQKSLLGFMAQEDTFFYPLQKGLSPNKYCL